MGDVIDLKTRETTHTEEPQDFIVTCTCGNVTWYLMNGYITCTACEKREKFSDLEDITT